MIFFIDASSLVKRYIEVGSDTVREILRRPAHGGAFYVSDHVLLEVLVRLAKHRRTSGRSLRGEYAEALRQFDRDREIFNIVPAGTRAVARAEQLAVEFARSGAGTLDLLHAPPRNRCSTPSPMRCSSSWFPIESSDTWSG